MKIYIVVNKQTGQHRSNWNTGTRVWTKRHNAETFLKKERWRGDVFEIHEYDLSKIEPTILDLEEKK